MSLVWGPEVQVHGGSAVPSSGLHNAWSGVDFALEHEPVLSTNETMTPFCFFIYYGKRRTYLQK